MKEHYDIGLYGWWGHENFGGILTYFALEQTLKSMGKSVLMIQEALGATNARYKIPDDSIAMQFAKKHYNCSEQLYYTELGVYNDICDTFVVGGDQLWNYQIPFVAEDNFLSFVNDDKRKLSYSTSFGGDNYFPPYDFLKKNKKFLQTFNAISVREDYAVDTAKSVFNADATYVIDAAFLPDISVYEGIAAEATVEFKEKYLLAFILNPSVEKRRIIENIAKNLELEIILISDAAKGYHEQFANVFSGMNILNPLSIENFLYSYMNASYVVTDSFHGTCFCQIFHKDFSVFYNELRGSSRFVSLNKMLKLENRRIYEHNTLEEIRNNSFIGTPIDWAVTDQNVAVARDFAMKWLKGALDIPVNNRPSAKNIGVLSEYELVLQKQEELADKLNKNDDFAKVKLLVALLRDYQIKNIVLSPGGRNILISRMLEANGGHFKLHYCVDERSAGYFAMGLATKLRTPVAIMCTSGTAASNYMPAITEAFYTGVPLIAITADRYQNYLNQKEDQMIPQVGMFDKVVKKSCNLTNASGVHSAKENRRLISECILECTHNGLGPVHINVPILDSEIGVKAPGYAWQIPTTILHPHILRVTRSDGEEEWNKWVNELRKSKRILIVYGQNFPPSEEEKRNIERFAEKYNCVIDADYISNLHCSHCVHPYHPLLRVDGEFFRNELTPDILITVGGRRIMNDPLMFKVRGCSIRHWSVISSGEIQDTYYHLSSVLECTQEWFFKYFADNAGEIHNDDVYYNKWVEFVKKNPYLHPTDYSSQYVLSSLMKYIPDNSMLHLGVGCTFIDAQKFPLKESVEVFCNMGTNGIDGGVSTFMGQAEVSRDNELCFLAIGDLSFFYDMNGLWNKNLKPNIRIMLTNNHGSALLRGSRVVNNLAQHSASARGWVESLGFKYLSASTKEEFDKLVHDFVKTDSDQAMFFEVVVP